MTAIGTDILDELAKVAKALQEARARLLDHQVPVARDRQTLRQLDRALDYLSTSCHFVKAFDAEVESMLELVSAAHERIGR